MFLILRDKTIKLASIPGLVNLSKVLIGAVLVRFWGNCIFSLTLNLEADCTLLTKIRQQHMLNEKQFIDG